MRLTLFAFLLFPGLAFAQYPNAGPGPPPAVLTVKALATPAPASITGPVVATNIAVVPVPAGLGKNGSVQLSCLWTTTGDTNTRTIYVVWSNTSAATAVGTGLAMGANVVLTLAAQVSIQTWYAGRNMNATNAQKSFPATSITPFGTSISAHNAGTVDTSLPSFLNINAIPTNAGDTVTVEGCQGFATISSP